ncbi:P-loop containing nucleoside triphosphate hydrolase protein [Ilyonectria robusta]|uniref:P-loop containing nucleoside triphosphate hydrolase protein n=1 Tax=Ilyonectria robusta TaxID=1079257 RepID=UPI001E8E1C39|nr:P-loop containing nucleoside triphosphate hydrolase protein [Ilyonectria robusta]KAH8664768.1 P-loop containing nucleoside triphosphate hydrolase protein [Ilyonectria robusta]
MGLSPEDEEPPTRERTMDIIPPTTLKTMVIHAVRCDSALSGHGGHNSETVYLDQPRLFKGDSRASALRGQVELPDDIDEYLETYDDVNLIIRRRYDCFNFHAQCEELFERLPQPIHPRLPPNVRSYFYILPNDSDFAPSYGEDLIPSRELARAMDTLSVHDVTFAGWQTNFSPPYLQLYQNATLLMSIAQNFLNKSGLSCVEQLIRYITETSGLEYEEADELFSQGLVNEKHLAKLFKSNDILVRFEEGHAVACVSTKCTFHQTTYPSLTCYSWAFDGRFYKVESRLTVQWPFNARGSIPITSLPIYPLKFDSTKELETTLRNRGAMFWACRKGHFVGYDAPKASFDIQVSNARYMIDMETYRELHGLNQNEEIRPESDLDKESMDQEVPPEDPFLLLLPAKVRGYGLHDKKWRTLYIRHLHEIQWNKKAFEQLVLDPHKKELVEAMVRIHLSSTASPDMIEGKGKGLIILLHGGPGTGKTLTAESVAELAERPLYRVTCGDIGTDPESVERYLDSALYIGKIWKAVVLLDESDVFLEEREKTDLQRNALVSVFIRVLEYYEGILILTSNRVGIFDEAFKSRVQLAMHYPPLDEKGRWQIWNNFFRLLEKKDSREDVNIEELKDKIDVLAKEKLNGRQIRNAITAARQLARFRNKPLGYTHLDQTIRVVDEFESYVEKTQGNKAGDYARATGIRLE